MAMPRPEHPFPQMERANWQNLNGEWNFAFDFGKSGADRKWYNRTDFEQKIIVPFCPESELSGIGYKDYMNAVWYQKNIEITEEQLNGRVIVHFGAVDFESHVYVNGKEAGMHKGGYSSFSYDITDALNAGTNSLTVYAIDDSRDTMQPRGKQSQRYESWGCVYTRTTGIWQTVWLEFVPKAYIKNVRYFTDIDNQTLTIEAKVVGTGVLAAKASFEGKEMGCGQVKIYSADSACLTIALSELHLWEAGCGNLYDLELTFGEDVVKSYFGMRSIRLDGYKYLINNKSVFQRLVLDQGFYPDGIYTAATDEALINDIKISMAVGFNGARLHEKMFEPRFLYHCDRLGYLVWGEHANWGCDFSFADRLKHFLPEWMETMERDFNHPSIIGWCPVNESWKYNGRMHDEDVIRVIYNATKQYDPTRPCLDVSGGYHVVTDIYDAHDYTQDPEEFAAHFAEFGTTGVISHLTLPGDKQIMGLPTFISEYGGIKWDVDQSIADSWGYGNGPKTEEEFIERYRGLTDVLLDNPNMFGFCYTQLYDVEQEVNGLYTYSRKAKFDPAIFHAINSRKAAIED